MDWRRVIVSIARHQSAASCFCFPRASVKNGSGGLFPLGRKRRFQNHRAAIANAGGTLQKEKLKMSSSQTEFRISVLLSVQRALLGEITPRMRRIEVILQKKTFHLKIWHEGAVTKKEKDDFDAIVISDVAADFWIDEKPPEVPTFEFVRCDPPEKPKTEGIIVFARKED